jgi:peptidoglycan-associated lipoprotein
MKRLVMVAMAAVLVFGLAGCGSKGQSGKMGAHTSGVGGADGFDGVDTWGRSEEELFSTRTYHFGFDRYDVADKDVPAINAQARYLASHPDARIRIEGHTDERGSREYNVALGERRANAVRAILAARGINDSQMATVSYGAEKPADMGHSEEAYAENRRAVIVYEAGGQ